MKSTIQKAQQGFTLIELMIVVAIIGILASVALPAYQDYTKKAKFTEVVLGTSGLKIAVEMCAQNIASVTGCTGGSNSIVNITDAASGAAGNIKTITVTDGVITATAVGSPTTPVNGLAGETYVMTPTFANGKVTWVAPGASTVSTCVGARIC